MKTVFKIFAFITLLSITVEGISQPIIETDTVIQTSLCAGSSVIIPFTVIDSAGSFNFGNIFTAQLSDPLGQFTNPIDIGSFLIPWTGSGFILGTVPVNTPLLGFYKIRVVGDNPAVIGLESPNSILIINTAVLAVIQASDSVYCEGDSLVLTATPIFESYLWDRNGTSIAGATQQTLTVTQPGTYTVSVKDTLQCESTSSGFNVYSEICVGIDEASRVEGIIVRPVPSSDLVTIEFSRDHAENTLIQIYDLQGELALTEEVSTQNGINQYKLDISTLPAGIYLVKIGSGNTVETAKLVKL